MYKLIIIFVILIQSFYVSSICFLSYERMNEIPIGSRLQISLVPHKCGVSNYTRFHFFISNSTYAYVIKNKTQCDIDVQKLTIDNYIEIQWMNITKTSNNPFCNIFNIYINGEFIKPISMFSNTNSYISYISNQCGSDAYDITIYEIIPSPVTYSTGMIIKINTFGTYKNILIK